MMTDQLLSGARLIAESYRFDRVTPEHLLHVLLQEEAHRREAERLGLDPEELRSILFAGLGFWRSGRLLGAHRLTVPDEVMRGLERSQAEGVPLIEAVLSMLIPERAQERTWRSSPLNEPVPDLDDLLDHLDGEEAHIGFDRICRDVFHKEARVSAPRVGGVDPLHERARHDLTDQDPDLKKGGGADRTSLSGKERAEAQRAVERSIRDLTALHRSGRLDLVIGRDAEIDQICEVLMRRRKSNVLLVGEPGVGKTALMEGVAARIADSPDPALSSRPVLQASLGALVAGARYRGDFEIRMELLVDLATERRAILFFDEMQMLIGSGATTDRGMDGANLLKPVLARDGISLVGATTLEEARLLRADPALMRRFEELLVEEPDVELMREILRGGSAAYLAHHRIRADERVLGRLVDFAARYLPARRFPDKAFDLLDTACVRARMSGRSSLKVADIRDAVRRLGGSLPDLSASRGEAREAEAARIRALLSERVGGQPDAVRDIAAAVAARTGPGPILLRLDGPRGVGGGTLVRALAQITRARLIEAEVMDGWERALPPRSDRDGEKRLLLLHAETLDERGVPDLLRRISFDGFGSTANRPDQSLDHLIVIVRTESERTSMGFHFSSSSERKNNDKSNKIDLSLFSGENLRSAVSFELKRMSTLMSDSGVSRPMPDLETVISSLPPVVSSWSEIVRACRVFMD